MASAVQNAYFGSDRAPVRAGSHQAQPQTVVSGELIVAIKISRSAIRGDQDIEISVVIVIAVSRSTADLRIRESGSGRIGDLSKITPAIVQEQVRRLSVRRIRHFLHRV